MVIAILALLLAACQGSPGVPQAGDADDPTAPQLALSPPLAHILPALRAHRVVLVGESHDRYDHHLIQLEIMKALHRYHGELVIGLECFQRPFQYALDRYVAGTLSEAGMLRETEYFQRWGFDYRLYRPILRHARARGIPLLALNAPGELVSKVGDGGLGSLAPEERARLPARIDAPDAAYIRRLRRVYEAHAGAHADVGAFEHFLEAQLVWDETMAATAAAHLEHHPGRHMMILAGIGHVGYRDAIPGRLLHRAPVSLVTVVPVDPGGDASTVEADHVLRTTALALPPAGRLGIAMEAVTGGVELRQVLEGSAAARAGLAVGDRLLRVAGEPVAAVADVRIALLDAAPGDAVAVEFLRGGQERRLTVVLGDD